MSSYLLYALGALGLFGASKHHQHAPSCDQLASLLEGKVFSPSTLTYNQSIGSYFSFHEQNVRPACVVRPADTADVSTIVTTMARTYHQSGDQLAIRSHGHMISAGAANVQDGVTVDLRPIDQVTVSNDRSTVRIGSRASWLQVYQTLDPLGLTVAGGRDASIGVGGFLTGGGISALSPAVGWGCDEVVEYEIVLASGEITAVTEASHRDLFLALKGGSNNFGVVTHFTMKAHPYSQIWGGFTAYPGDEIPRQIQAYSDFMEPENFDPDANIVQSYGWTSKQPAVFVTDILLYAKPEPHPPVFRSLVNNDTVLYSTLRQTNLSDFAIEEDSYQVPGFFTLYNTISFAHHATLYPSIVAEFQKSIAAISPVDGINWYLSIQPTAALQPGRNSLGLDPHDERLNILLLIAFFPNPADAPRVCQASEDLVASVEQITRAAGAYRSFKYLNYADARQDPISGYGETVKEALRAASRKYDPEGLFQGGVPGGFKLVV